VALTGRQQAFVDKYCQCWNAAEAARLAGYSPKTARSIGQENLTKPDIQAAIRQHVRVNAMSRDEALHRIGEQARLDLSPYIVIGDKGDISVDISELMAAGLGWAIKGIKRTKFGPEVEFHDRFAALQVIAQHHGLTKANAAGTLDDPLNAVMYTPEQWESRRQAELEKAEATMAAFEDADG
jgi:phage terminase small subunit